VRHVRNPDSDDVACTAIDQKMKRIITARQGGAPGEKSASSTQLSRTAMKLAPPAPLPTRHFWWPGGASLRPMKEMPAGLFRLRRPLCDDIDTIVVMGIMLGRTWP